MTDKTPEEMTVAEKTHAMKMVIKVNQCLIELAKKNQVPSDNLFPLGEIAELEEIDRQLTADLAIYERENQPQPVKEL